VSDYGKGAIDGHVASQVRALALPTFVDVKVRPDRWVEWCECAFPNEREYLLHKPDYQQAKRVVVKCSARGAMLIKDGVRHRAIPSQARHVKNVAGAGDTVVAAFTTSYMALKALGHASRSSTSLQLAMHFAGEAVEQELTAAPTFADVYLDMSPSSDFWRIAHRVEEELKK